MNFASRASVRNIFNACSSGERGEINEHHCHLYVSCDHGRSRNFLAGCLFEPARARTPRKDEYQTTSVPWTKPTDLTIRPHLTPQSV